MRSILALAIYFVVGTASPSASSERWLVGPLSAVSLGDSYAVRQTEPLEDLLGVPVLELAEPGSFAINWVDSVDEWAPDIQALVGPVFVLVNAGTNDERASEPFGRPPDEVGAIVNELIFILVTLRPDLQVVVAGYNCIQAGVSFQDYLANDTARFRYIETSQLRQVKCDDGPFSHPTEDGFIKRIRHILNKAKKKFREFREFPKELLVFDLRPRRSLVLDAKVLGCSAGRLAESVAVLVVPEEVERVSVLDICVADRVERRT